MDNRNHQQAELELLTRVADGAERDPKKAEFMKKALERYAQARALGGNGTAGDDAITGVERIEKI